MFRKNLSLSIALGAVTTLGVLAQPARAAIVNGGFEDLTDFNGWTRTGNTSIQQADFKTPPDGTKQAILSNNPQAIPGDAGAVTNIPSLDTFFNLGAGALEARNVQSGSGIKQTFFANTGDVISFKYDFATNEAPTSETTRDFVSLLPLTLSQVSSRFDYAYRARVSDKWDVDYYRVTAPAGATIGGGGLPWSSV